MTDAIGDAAVLEIFAPRDVGGTKYDSGHCTRSADYVLADAR
jgi:hypothetical protein